MSAQEDTTSHPSSVYDNNTSPTSPVLLWIDHDSSSQMRSAPGCPKFNISLPVSRH